MCLPPPSRLNLWSRLNCFNPSCFTSKVKRRLVFSYINSLNPTNTSAFRPLSVWSYSVFRSLRLITCQKMHYRGSVRTWCVGLFQSFKICLIDRLFLMFLADLCLSVFHFFYCVRIIPHPEKQL